jgi:hypothetical protein
MSSAFFKTVAKEEGGRHVISGGSLRYALRALIVKKLFREFLVDLGKMMPLGFVLVEWRSQKSG